MFAMLMTFVWLRGNLRMLDIGEANDAFAWSNIRRMKPRGQVLKKCSRGSEHGSWMARGALSESWFRDVCLSEFICEI
ncbi:MAG: hypothetical protein ACTS7I_02185 [Candidatus Hodgkinia cicadicola]